MRWLVDAELPRRLAERLASFGQDAVHTRELPAGNRTPDDEITRIANEQTRVVVTKDSDFVDSHLVIGMPPKLLWVTTGNITNDALLLLFFNHLPDIEAAFASSNYVELNQGGIIIH